MPEHRLDFGSISLNLLKQIGLFLSESSNFLLVLSRPVRVNHQGRVMAKAVIPAEGLATASEPALSHGANAHSLLIAEEAFDALLKAHGLGSRDRNYTLHHLGA